MTKNKSELILNPDSYSAYAYMAEETEETISIKMILKPLIAIVVISALVLVYTYYIKNNLTSIGLWFNEIKQIILLEDKKIIKNENLIMPKKIEPVVKAEHSKEQVLIVKKIKKEVSIKEVIKVIRPKSLDSTVLTDEYIKLMQKSLGKY